MDLKLFRLVILGTFLAPALASGAIDFTHWHTPAEINTEMSNLVAAHPTRAALVAIGTTVEGRAINALKISDNVATDESDEGDVIFVGVHHAREWISAEMSLYLAEYLLNVYASGSDPELISCMNNLEIWIIPALNQDGYVYSTTAGNRYWRKNRRNNLDSTFGVDLNRNYSYQWGLGSGVEGSPYTYDDTYEGPSAFSELETTALRDFVLALDDPRALLTFHSFSQLVLRPWSYTSTNPPGHKTLKYIVDDTIARIAAVHGLTYGDSIWYNSFGEAGDYFWGERRIASFTIEERPASGGVSGFDPPTNQIIPNAEENLPAALALIRDAGCRKLWIKDYSGDTGTEPSAVWTGSGWTHAFWESPDIWTTPTELVEGAAVTLHVRVHNATTSTMSGAKVVAWVTDPRLTLEFPATTSTLIGEQTVNIAAGDTTYTFPWTVPTGTNSWGEWHWCVGAGVYHTNDRPLTTQVQRTSNIGCRNFNTTPAPLTAALARQPFVMTVENFLDVPAEYRIEVELPERSTGWRVRLPEGDPTTLPAARLLGVTRNVLLPGESRCVPVRIDVPQDLERGSTHEIRLHSALIPLVAGKRVPVGNGYTIQIRAPKR